jgi:hypothetical protein
MRKLIFTGSIVASLIASSIAAIAAQSPVGSPQQNPVQSPTRPAAPQVETRTAAPATLTGCLYSERDVPGRTPNLAEKAGVLEDYILAEVTAAGSSESRSPSPGVAGTSGTSPAMYKVENIPDDRLRALVGKRVEVVGRIDAEGGQASPSGVKPDRGLGPDQVNLPEFEATSIKEVTGTCPAKSAGR